MSHWKIAGVLGLAGLVNALAPIGLQQLAALPGAEGALALTLWCVSLFLVFGWGCNKAAAGTRLPSFALQLLVGIVLHDALSPLATQWTLSVVLCTALAALILKEGGDGIERNNFLPMVLPTVLLAVVGYLITFFVMFVLLTWLGFEGRLAALLAAIIGSTDPAALVPTFKQLVFKAEFKRVSDLSLAESALNDAVGAIFTGTLVLMVVHGAALPHVFDLAQGLLSTDNLALLAHQLLWGAVAGVLGWLGMSAFERYAAKQRPLVPAPYDFALVLALPLVTFVLAQLLHGNGFLAAFVVGVLSNFNRSHPAFHQLLYSMEVKMESLAKPIIFMMVGPFVSVHDLIDTAWQGFVVSLLFMLVARPLAVWLALLPTQISWREKLFLCGVRETGVIPVVLAVLTAAQLPGLTQLMPLTAWVVIWTLTLLPALTPWWARRWQLLDDTVANTERTRP